MKQDFCLPHGTYLLNHSVGKPLKTAQQAFKDNFLEPWQYGETEPWGTWLNAVNQFTAGLAQLFNSKAELFCPQANLSSGLTKLLMSHPKLSNKPNVVMSEIDFPSMGFAIQQAVNANITFIPKELDITDEAVWSSYISDSTDLVFVSHAYSNTGQVSPLKQVVNLAKQSGALSIVDVAQSVGVMPLDLSDIQPDFLIGSSVKWLCSGPGAAYLWIAQQHLAECKPKDLGWFSHQNPFEFDIHHFDYHDSALRFWGGTPSIAPYVFAAHSLAYFNNLGVEQVHAHNRKLQAAIIDAFGEELVSPLQEQKRSGTVILNFADNQAVLNKLAENKIAVDARIAGLRVSPHIYNDEEDIAKFVQTLKG